MTSTRIPGSRRKPAYAAGDGVRPVESTRLVVHLPHGSPVLAAGLVCAAARLRLGVDGRTGRFLDLPLPVGVFFLLLLRLPFLPVEVAVIPGRGCGGGWSCAESRPPTSQKAAAETTIAADDVRNVLSRSLVIILPSANRPRITSIIRMSVALEAVSFPRTRFTPACRPEAVRADRMQ